MLGKLLKHEMIYLIKTFSPLYIVYLILAGVIRLLSLFENQFEDLDTSSSGAITLIVFAGIIGVAYGVLTGILALLTMIDNVRRFKNNMFTDEGYLTNTLPVTATEHIAAKLLAGIINYLASVVVILAGLFIASGDEAPSMAKGIWEAITSDSIPLSQKLIGLLLGFMIYVSIQLLGYLLSALGNMVNSCKGLLSFGLGFFSVIFVMIMSARITAFATSQSLSGEQTILCICAFLLVCCICMYLLIVNIIKKHLNLQ